MPQYRFDAQNPQGERQEGLLSASNVQEAMHQLASRGFRVKTIKLDSNAPTPVPPAHRQSAPQAVRPVPTPQPTVVPVRLATPPAAYQQKADPINVKRKLARHKDRWLFFTQLGKFLGSGIPPHDAFQRLGAQFHHPGIREFCAQAAPEIAEGRPMSDLMQRCPWIFHQGDIGMVRAGEMGGFLPEAVDRLAARCRNAHSFTKMFWFIFVILSQAIVALPLFILVGRALLSLVKVMNSGYQGDYLPVFWRALGQGFLSTLGITVLLMILMFTFGMWLFMGYRMRRWRHGLSRVAPHTRKMANAENLEEMTWTLSRLSRAGISPQICWTMSAQSVPNESYAEQFTSVSRSLNERMTLGEAFETSRAFRPEYVSMVRTGEYTGTAPAVLQELTQVLESERISKVAWMKSMGIALSILVMIGLSCAGFLSFYTSFLSGTMDTLDPVRVTDPEQKPDFDPNLIPK